MNLNFFLFFFRSGGSLQSRAQIRVTGFGGVVGFTVGFGMKNSCGAAGYTRIAGVGLGFSLQISWGKYLNNGMSGG